jgi:hypothetical protein
MKSLQKAIQDRDLGTLQSMMAEDNSPNIPGSYDAIDLFNELFRQIRATMPAAVATIKTQADLDELRRQWTMAFKENGIRTVSQIEAGMVIARQQEKPFLPSPGQFVAWCKDGSRKLSGLPDADELIAMVKQYADTCWKYRSPQDYPWPNNATYWLVMNMRSGNWSTSDMRREACREIALMGKRIDAGETIPAPIVQLPPRKSVRPLSPQKGLEKIAEIREKLGLGKGGNNGH